MASETKDIHEDENANITKDQGRDRMPSNFGLEYDDDLSYDTGSHGAGMNGCFASTPSIKSISQHSSSNRLFNESEAEDGYHTSREYEFVFSSFKIGNDLPSSSTMLDASLPDTPLVSNSQGKSAASDLERRGVKIDPMMQLLFGIEFLPFDERIIESAQAISSESYLSIPTFSEDNMSFGSSAGAYDGSESYVYEDDSSLLEDEGEHVNQLSSKGDNSTRRRKNKRRKRGFGLRRGFNAKKENRKNRRLVKKLITKGRQQQRQDVFQDASKNIMNQMMQIEEGRRKLRSVNANLRQVKSENKRIFIETQRCSTRINKFCKTVTELECQLDIAMKSLEKEKVRLASNIEAVTKLDRIRTALEDKARGVEQKLSQKLGYIEQYQSSSSNVVAVHNLAESRTRVNTATDASFMTADEPPPSPLSSNLDTPEDFNLDIQCQKKRKGKKRGKIKVSPKMRCSSLDSFEYALEDTDRPDSVGSPASANDATVVATPKQDTEKNKRKSNFLRIHDLQLLRKQNGEIMKYESTDSAKDSEDSAIEPNQTVSNRMDLYSLDCDDRNIIFFSLSKRGLDVATNEGSMWTPDRTTDKILNSRSSSERKWHFASDNDVFVWSGKFDFVGFGDDIPAVKARGLVPTSAKELLSLMMDSTRVKEYNKMSLGRTDQFFFKKGVDSTENGLKGEAKVFRSLSSVPLIRKQIELLGMMYAKPFDEDVHGSKGYIVVTRSVWEDENNAPTKERKGDSNGKADFIRSEMLLSVNCIRDLSTTKPDHCELTTVTHFHTPGMPTIGAKTMGMKAATNFIRDIQSIFTA